MIKIFRRNFSKQSFPSSIEEATRNLSGFSDFRSDTVTQPSAAMRHAMAHGSYGDDVFNDCSTTKAFQKKVADLFGKEDALLVATGTQANLISAMLMAKGTASSLIIGSKTHLAAYERGGMSVLGRIFPTVLPNELDGTITLDAIDEAIPVITDSHVVPVFGMSLESSHNHCSGRVLRPDYISKVKKLLKKKKIPLHLDGARCWNATLSAGVDIGTYAKDFDLVSCCLSKGIGCPAGSLVVGSHDDIKEARNLRKMLGGGMRQGAGILAACGFIALEDWQEKLTFDNANAAWMAQELAGLKGVVLNPAHVETNIVRFTFEPKLLKDLKTDYVEIAKKMYDDKVWVLTGFRKNNIRAVTHRDVTRADCEKLVKSLRAAIKQ